MSNKLVTAYDMIKARDATIDELQDEVSRLAPYEMFYERTMKRAEAAERRVAELEAMLLAMTDASTGAADAQTITVERRQAATEWPPPPRAPSSGRP